jgi:hypothetical protein
MPEAQDSRAAGGECRPGEGNYFPRSWRRTAFGTIPLTSPPKLAISRIRLELR